jgi:hypothetical protein
MAKNIQLINYATLKSQSEVLMNLGLDKNTADFWSPCFPTNDFSEWIPNPKVYPKVAGLNKKKSSNKSTVQNIDFIPHWSFQALTQSVFSNMDWNLKHEGDEFAFELVGYKEFTSWESTAINAIFEVAKKYLEQKIGAFENDELF